MSKLPEHVEREAKRILDGAARRLLAEKLDGNAIGALPESPNRRRSDRRPNQPSLLGEREVIPAVDGDGQRRAEAA